MDHNPQVIDRVLALLRSWGWEVGLARLKSELTQIVDREQAAALRCFIAWMAAERGFHDVAIEQLDWLQNVNDYQVMAQLGLCFVRMRNHQYADAHGLLDQVPEPIAASDAVVRGIRAWLRGTIFYREGKLESVLPLLYQALEDLGADRLSSGRVLDTLGMVYAARNNYHAARLFYEHALAAKARFQDDAGLALTHGQLGRLFLDWGDLDRARRHFEADLEIARCIADVAGEARMYNHLGQVGFRRGDYQTATAWLDESIRLSKEGKWRVSEALARKDLALVQIAVNQLDEATRELDAAEDLLRSPEVPFALAHVQRARGLCCRAQGRFDEAEKHLRSARAQFAAQNELAEAAHTALEMARTLRARRSAPPLIELVLDSALELAERCRRQLLIDEIEQELRQVNESRHCRSLYRRVRGHSMETEPISLIHGRRESVSIMFMDLKGSTEFARATDAAELLLTINQLMADLAPVLERYDVEVNQYLGDGFMALIRGADHAARAVAAALEIGDSLREFNRPRRVLKLQQFCIRVGISTGEVVTGNVGTYRKLDYTAIGVVTNLAARLQSEADPGLPCISRATRERVGDRFNFRSTAPRTLTLKGIGECDVWDVTGRKV